MQEWQEDEEAQEQLRLAIQSLVGMLFFKRVEVPVVAMFHKEMLGELLSTREFEVPRTVTVRPHCLPQESGTALHGGFGCARRCSRMAAVMICE